MILTNCKVSGANSMSDVDYKQVGARDRLIAAQNVLTVAFMLTALVEPDDHLILGH